MENPPIFSFVHHGGEVGVLWGDDRRVMTECALTLAETTAHNVLAKIRNHASSRGRVQFYHNGTFSIPFSKRMSRFVTNQSVIFSPYGFERFFDVQNKQVEVCKGFWNFSKIASQYHAKLIIIDAFLDYATGYIDYDATQRIMEALKEIAKENDCAILILDDERTMWLKCLCDFALTVNSKRWNH